MEKECLAGQTAIVTGSSSGIGFAIAIALAKAGANLIVNYHSDDKGAGDAVSQIQQAGSKAIAVQADIAKEEDVLRLFDEARKAFVCAWEYIIVWLSSNHRKCLRLTIPWS